VTEETSKKETVWKETSTMVAKYQRIWMGDEAYKMHIIPGMVRPKLWLVD